MNLNNIEQLQGLFSTLEAQEKMKKDYVVNGKDHIHFLDGKLVLVQDGKEIEYQPTTHFHNQVAEKLQIPAGYYKRMLEQQRNLLDENVNTWLQDSQNFLVRTFENANESYNTARAFLSDSYSVIDNYQILVEALEAIKKTGLRVEIVNAELSDTRLYLKVVCPEVEVDGAKMLRDYRVDRKIGSGVISGFVLSNSEVGKGSFLIQPRALVLTCGNGAINVNDNLKRVHLGGKLDELGFEKNERIRLANLRLIKEQVQHAVKVFLSKEYTEKLVNVYYELGNAKIEAPIDKVIQVIGKEYQINEERKANILKYFVEGGDTRRMGIASAMTREVQSLKDADLRHETEVASFEVLQNFGKIEAAAMKIKNSSN
jgi:hypothetical protein